jgi:fibronectin type 3 domain-containing protein
VLPAAPTGVIAAGGTKQVTLSWGAVSTATSYNIYYGAASGVTKSNGIKIANATSPSVLTGLVDGATYYYIVSAVNSDGEGPASVQVAATTLTPVPAPTAPAAPTGVSAVGGANQATISWPAVSGASSYNVYWSATSGVTKTNGTKVAGVTSPYVKTGLAAGTTYYFIVTAVNSVGESAASPQASAATNLAPPTAPTGVTATGGANQVSISWPAVSGATSYNIYYATATGVTKANGIKITNATSPYSLTGLADGTTYNIIVAAVNSAGEGSASAQASAATNAAPVIDGLALYNSTCSGCHGTAKLGKSVSAIQGAIAANTGGMGSLSYLTTAQITAIAATTAPTTPPPAPACGSCHAIPPATGHHAFHISQGLTCTTCHGSGYSSTTVNAATHNNGTVNLSSTIGYSGGKCSNSCHGSKTW